MLPQTILSSSLVLGVDLRLRSSTFPEVRICWFRLYVEMLHLIASDRPL